MYTLCNGSLQVRSESDHCKIPWRPTTHLPFPDHCKCITTLKSAKHCFFIIQKAKTNPKSLFTIVDPWKLNCNLSQVCAIVGGTFTVAGIIDSCIFSGKKHAAVATIHVCTHSSTKVYHTLPKGPWITHLESLASSLGSRQPNIPRLQLHFLYHSS